MTSTSRNVRMPGISLNSNTLTDASGAVRMKENSIKASQHRPGTRGPRRKGRPRGTRPAHARGRGDSYMETAEAREPGFRDMREMLESVRSAMKFLAAADMTQLPGECIAE